MTQSVENTGPTLGVMLCFLHYEEACMDQLDLVFSARSVNITVITVSGRSRSTQAQV
ncbi:MAG: hypothetical protein IIC60_07740 [Proteobacteria bacterium]|nr:hypothetical protein [Pseudomonadota bacterium]